MKIPYQENGPKAVILHKEFSVTLNIQRLFPLPIWILSQKLKKKNKNNFQKHTFGEVITHFTEFREAGTGFGLG